jgi:hypothetical protein
MVRDMGKLPLKNCSVQPFKFTFHLVADEPWGKMQPIRHALGGLLLEQGHVEEAEQVFREDLKFHPRNPWALVGLISALKTSQGACCGKLNEIDRLEEQLREQRAIEMADFQVRVACACCNESQ